MRVAVYGTLKKGFGNHYLLENSEFKSEILLRGFDMYSLGGFPACSFGKGIIYAEIYDVDRPTLENLDRLEGHPNWYKRKTVETHLGQVWIYTFEKEQCENLDVVPTEHGVATWI